MNFDRRRLLGAVAAASASLVVAPAERAPRRSAQSPARPPKSGITPAPAQSTLLRRAVAALDRHAGAIIHRDRVGIVDFTAPSRLPRFHLVNLGNGTISTHLVSHGSGSDPENSGWLQRFSNLPGSNASSRGSFLSGETYVGKHGRSLRLLGLEPENDMALPRGIVIHAADYVSDAFARQHRRVGRSQGCFAVSDTDIGLVLDQLGSGRLLFAWK